MDHPSGRVIGGMQDLAVAMAAELEQTRPGPVVRLETPVLEIRSEESGIWARTHCGELGARHLVLALPPALAVARIGFSPGLPERLRQLAANTPVWMGAVVKVVASYPEAFWRHDGLAGAAMSHIGPLREIHDMSGPSGHPAALFGFAMPRAEQSIDRAVVLGQLAELFGPAAAEPLSLWIQDWRRELHTSPPGVEGLAHMQLFGHPTYAEPALGGRLHWASTEVSSTFPGHIEGALEAAEKVARAILSDLRQG